MKLQDILNGVDLTKTKLVRHNLSNEFVAHAYSHGYIDIYQRIQNAKQFKGCDYILSFLGIEGTEGRFLGCYKITGPEKFDPALLPNDFLFQGDMNSNTHVFWGLKKTDILSDLVDRLTIDWGKSTQSWCQKATNEKEILYILPVTSDIKFVSYDKVLLSYDSLREIVTNKKLNKEWEDKLSAVAGIYLITDTKTAKHYVGSASGEQGGIWKRWSDYALTKHGGNKQLQKIIYADPEPMSFS